MSELGHIRRQQAAFCDELGLKTRRSTLPSGLPLHLVIKDSPGKPWLVFLHGFPDTWWIWRSQIRHFAATHSILALDLPGFGSAATTVTTREVSIQRVIVPALCNLLASLGSDIHLVGHDLGALLAWYIALECQSSTVRISHLTVFGIGHPRALLRSLLLPWNWLKARHWFFFVLPRPLPERALRACNWYLLRRLTRFHEEFQQWRPELEQPGATTHALNWFRGNLLPSLRLRRELRPQLNADVLAIRTEDDLLYTSRDQIEDSRSLVLGAFRVVHLEDMSHWPMRDDPHLINHLIAANSRGSRCSP